jgi:methionyl-tRNA formyltransferase
LKGLTRSGVTLFELQPEADTGDILAAEEFDVALDETATQLYEKARVAHVALMRRAWPQLKAGTLKGVPQDENQATHWPARRPEDGQIQPGMGLGAVEALVRATTHPYPGAFVMIDGQKLVIWSGRICALAEARLRIPALIRGEICYEPLAFDWHSSSP